MEHSLRDRLHDLFLLRGSGSTWVENSGRDTVLIVLAIVGAVLFAAGWIAGWPARLSRRTSPGGPRPGSSTARSSGLARICSFFCAPIRRRPAISRLSAPIMFGIPWVLSSQLIAEMVFVGLGELRDRLRQRSGMARPRRGFRDRCRNRLGGDRVSVDWRRQSRLSRDYHYDLGATSPRSEGSPASSPRSLAKAARRRRRRTTAVQPGPRHPQFSCWRSPARSLWRP